MTTIGIIPARAGSKRVKGKNFRMLGAKTLLERAIDTALAVPELDKVVVTSDSEEALTTCNFYAEERLRCMKRPDHMATDESPAIDYVRHVLKRYPADVVAIIQPSSPFTEPQDVSACLWHLDTMLFGAAATVAPLPFDHHPKKLVMAFVTHGGDPEMVPVFTDGDLSMMRHKSDCYVRNGSVYATITRNVHQYGVLMPETFAGVMMPPERSLDINDEWDWELALMMERRLRERREETREHRAGGKGTSGSKA